MLFYKKYPNRRLYDCQESRYVTLADIADAVRDRLDVEITQHVGKANITRAVLMQTLAEVEGERETPKLSVEQLRELIRG